MIKFIEQFTKEKVFDEALVKRIGNDFFLIKPELASVMKKILLPPLSAGLYLGRFLDKTAKPSLDLLQMLSKTNAKKVWLNEKGAWMFVCKRPALAQSIVKNEAAAGELVLVLTERDECIGYGVFDGKGVKNYYDIGDFLRRERKAKRF
jgi:ribosome biogenesis protein Nip4